MIIDSMVTIGWIINANESDYSEKILLLTKDHQCYVPSCWVTEVVNGLINMQRQKIITKAMTVGFLNGLKILNIIVDNVLSTSSIGKMVELADRYQLSGYQAAYLELSLRRQCSLATTQTALVNAATECGVEIF